MAFVMSRLKELRDMGFTILLLHHTPKGNDQTYKGSTAILDLADHVLSLHKVRKGSLEETDDEESENVYYRFGTKHKTRYEPFHIFLEFQKEHGFVVAPDPDTVELEEIYDLLREQKELLKQSQVFDLVKAKLGINSKGKVVKLLNKGIGKYWETRHDEGKGRAVFYCPIVQPYIDKDNETIPKSQGIDTLSLSKTDRTEGPETHAEKVDNTILSDCPSDIQTIKTDDKIEDSEVFKKEYLNHYLNQELPLPEAKRLARMDYEADHGTWEGQKMQTEHDPLELLSIKRIADILHRNQATIRGYIRRYNIPHIERYIGYRGSKAIYVLRKDLERFIWEQFNDYPSPSKGKNP
jgi:hypothetical protein